MPTTLGFLPQGSEWIYILLIVVILFGSNKIPELMRSLGRSVAEFKRARQDGEKEAELLNTKSDNK